MEYQALNSPEVASILIPETELERQILSNTEVIKGLTWGYPRFGHPEGKVLFHVKEIFENIEKLNTTPELRRKLRTLALVHDTFKYQEDRKLMAKDPTKHHAHIAYKFLKKITNEKDVLAVVKTHDDAYYAWRSDYAYRDPETAEEKFDCLLKVNKNHLELYYSFFVCDTRTGDKNQSPIRWFEEKTNWVNKIKI